jgi:hypothetical protein
VEKWSESLPNRQKVICVFDCLLGHSFSTKNLILLALKVLINFLA